MNINAVTGQGSAQSACPCCENMELSKRTTERQPKKNSGRKQQQQQQPQPQPQQQQQPQPQPQPQPKLQPKPKPKPQPNFNNWSH